MFGNRLPFTTADFNIVPGVDRLANSATDIAVAGLVIGFVDRAADFTVVSLADRTSDGVADIPVTGVVDRLADRVAFITVAGLVNVLSVLHGNFFADRIIDGLLTGVVLFFPYGFDDCFVAGT